MVLSLEQLEQRFLEIAPEDGVRVNKLPNFPSDIDKTISQEVARADVAVLAKLLIQAYGGWPFYSKILRCKILTVLSRIYDSISGPIKICELYEQLKPIVAMMPDHHIMLCVDKNPAINRVSPIDVGDNLVKSRNINEPYLIEKHGRIGIIAISQFFAPDDLEHIRQQVLDIMSGTDAIIIDLRNNGGGSMYIASMLGKTLSGYDLIPRSRRMFTRNTPLARKLHQYITDFSAIKKISKNAPDPVMIVDNSKFKMPKNHKWAFSGDIYILVNNRSASSSETVIEYLKYNPRTKLIGAHTSGCNQYVHYRFVELSGSGIHVRLPLVYKEVSHVKSQKFEMHGYAPDIECKPGTDAMNVALTKASTNFVTENTCCQRNLEKRHRS
ncbi:MAG: S41 family peptidase [Alphaproteobacteria bacterium]|nr:S41 family peptidase [Alphaproteobacteria bacterium]